MGSRGHHNELSPTLHHNFSILRHTPSCKDFMLDYLFYFKRIFPLYNGEAIVVIWFHTPHLSHQGPLHLSICTDVWTSLLGGALTSIKGLPCITYGGSKLESMSKRIGIQNAFLGRSIMDSRLICKTNPIFLFLFWVQTTEIWWESDAT